MPAGQGQIDEMRSLLADGVDVNECPPWHHTPLTFASLNGHTSIVSVLLAAGADVDLDLANQLTLCLWPACAWLHRHGLGAACCSRRPESCRFWRLSSSLPTTRRAPLRRGEQGATRAMWLQMSREWNTPSTTSPSSSHPCPLLRGGADITASVDPDDGEAPTPLSLLCCRNARWVRAPPWCGFTRTEEEREAFADDTADGQPADVAREAVVSGSSSPTRRERGRSILLVMSREPQFTCVGGAYAESTSLSLHPHRGPLHQQSGSL